MKHVPHFLVTLGIFALTSYTCIGQHLSVGWFHTLYNCSDQSVMSWGLDCDGRLGLGGGSRNLPHTISSLENVIAVRGGGYHSLFLKSDGTVFACGKNQAGQLGNTQTSGSVVYPSQIGGFSNIIGIETGVNSSFFIREDGTVLACGNNMSGMLGIGSNNEECSIPTEVVGLTGIVAISSYELQTLFLKSDGTVWAAGSNFSGMAGMGYVDYSLVPIQVEGVEGIVAVAAGKYHSLFLKADGTVYACGWNQSGSLGDGTVIDRTVPVLLPEIQHVTAIEAGNECSFFILSDSTVLTCGRFVGMYTSAGSGNVSAPQQILGLDHITEMGIGDSHWIFERNDSTLLGIGYDLNGELGDGPELSGDWPVMVQGLCGAPITLSSGDHQPSGEFSLGPNPTAGEPVMICSAANTHIQGIEICSLDGSILKTLYQEPAASTTLEMNYPDGVYLIRIYSDMGVDCQKVVVRKN